MNGTATIALELQIASAVGDCPERDIVAQWAAAALSGAGIDRPGAMTVRLVDNDESRALNAAYRGKDRPTNVLAFPGSEPLVPLPDTEREIGDLVICAPLVSEEAARAGKTFSDHLAHLVVHGTLHLAGYDHDNDNSASEMERLEIETLARLGMGNPYQRAG